MFPDQPSVFRRDPTRDEVAAANAEIVRQEQAVGALELQIQGLMSEIGRLRTAQRGRQEMIHRCKGVITLARRIPEELLAKIFEYSAADGWTRAPVVVSHVCSAWRRAAMAPRVWSHIYLDGNSVDALGRTRLWLQRAQYSPLHITIVASLHTPHTHLVDTIGLLRLRASHWEFLRISADGLSNTRFIMSHFTQPMNSLRELEIQTSLDLDWDWDEGFTLSDVFAPHLAPQLTEIRFTCNVLPRDLRMPPHIKTLVINVNESSSNHPLSIQPFLDLLEGLPELEELTIQFPLIYEVPPVDEDPQRTVDLPHLASLTLYGPTDLNGFLAHIHAYNLRELHLRSLENIYRHQEPIGPTLLQFLDTSHPPLQTLELHDIDLTPDNFKRCFAALPGLRLLRLHESSISDGTIRLLAGREAMCPKLTQLELRWCSHLDGGALVDLVKDRADVIMDRNVAVEPISELGLLNCCYVGEQDVLQMARMTTVRLSLHEDDFCRKPFSSCAYPISLSICAILRSASLLREYALPATSPSTTFVDSVARRTKAIPSYCLITCGVPDILDICVYYRIA